MRTTRVFSTTLAAGLLAVAMGGVAAAAEDPTPQTKDIKPAATGTSAGSDADQSARIADGTGRCPRPTHDCDAKSDHKAVDKPDYRPEHKPVEATEHESVDRPVDKPEHKPAEKPADRPIDRPIDKPAHKPVDRPAVYQPVENQDHRPDTVVINRPVVINPHVHNTTNTINTTVNNTVNITANNHITNVANNHKNVVNNHKTEVVHEHGKHESAEHTHHKNHSTMHHMASPAAHHGTQTRTMPVGAVAGGSGGTTESDTGLLALGGALAVAGAGAGVFALRRGSLRG